MSAPWRVCLMTSDTKYVQKVSQWNTVSRKVGTDQTHAQVVCTRLSFPPPHVLVTGNWNQLASWGWSFCYYAQKLTYGQLLLLSLLYGAGSRVRVCGLLSLGPLFLTNERRPYILITIPVLATVGIFLISVMWLVMFHLTCTLTVC